MPELSSSVRARGTRHPRGGFMRHAPSSATVLAGFSPDRVLHIVHQSSPTRPTGASSWYRLPGDRTTTGLKG